MTDKPVTLGHGRLYFPHQAMPPRPPGPMRTMSGTFTMELKMPNFRAAQLAQDFFGRSPIPHLCGYDPQKLLPPPRDPYAAFAELRYSDMRESGYLADLFRPSDFRYDEMIDFAKLPTGRRAPSFKHLYDGVPTHRWKRAVIVVGTDFSDVEARILAASRIPGVVALQLDLQESKGEIFGPYGIYERPFIPEKKPLKQNGRSASYLDHDPTKRHKKGRR